MDEDHGFNKVYFLFSDNEIETMIHDTNANIPHTKCNWSHLIILCMYIDTSVYICMYVCLSVCLSVYIYIYWNHTRWYWYIYVCIYIYLFIGIYKCITSLYHSSSLRACSSCIWSASVKRCISASYCTNLQFRPLSHLPPKQESYVYIIY